MVNKPKSFAMNKTRIEAFSDGVMAIIITIMVLELKTPKSYSWEDMKPLLTMLECYVMSFALVATYWANHHHLMHCVIRVTAKIIWANMLLLLCLSLVPFVTKWVGENGFDKVTVIAYATVCTLCAFAYTILQQTIIGHRQLTEKMLGALKRQSVKGMVSVSGYFISIALAFVMPLISELLFVAIPVIWIIPDRNIERAVED